MKVIMVVLKAILKLLEIFVNGSPSDNSVSMNPTQHTSENNTPILSQSQNNLSVRMDNSARLEQMWEVYNRVIKMKEEQARSDAEEIVKLRFQIEDLQEELAREKRHNEELKTRLKKQDPPPNNTKCNIDGSDNNDEEQ